MSNLNSSNKDFFVEKTCVVVSLDRGLPMVRTGTDEFRAQLSTEAEKNLDIRPVIGDIVVVDKPSGHDIAIINKIMPRRTQLCRRSLVESVHEGQGKANQQILAVNFDYVFVVCALGRKPIDLNYLERQLVMAHDSGAEVVVVLTKADTHVVKRAVSDTDNLHAGGRAVCDRNDKRDVKHAIGGQVDSYDDVQAAKSVAMDCRVIVESAVTGDGLAEIESILASSKGVGVLLGRSGVGKSTLVNELLGAPLLQIGEVRGKDNAGRHTTVARKLVYLPKGGALVDAPGLRSIGLLGAELGLQRTFPEIYANAANCRYRDCTHASEPNCAVLAAQSAGKIQKRRLDSYLDIANEVFD
ncbi:MAG: ribosome small subunit-dependent GTPase A [Coriobacteriales bacterium]|jgi:ribosome biogenesis GTPase|nr:ribosome small subunit-dependent GTPase A [Coriobacteriales bacterium]